VFAFSFLIGYQVQVSALLSWILYFSLTLRNTWLAFILDRYFHYLLFYAIFLDTAEFWSVDKWRRQGKAAAGGGAQVTNTTVCTVATVAIKLQILWLYLDAGSGKYMDPLGGWTYNADPLPALDTYTRHTIGARYMYALFGPQGLRLMTPMVVYVELLCAPVALLGSYLGWNVLVSSTVFVICKLHIGIAITTRNTVLLSLVACSAWCVYLPEDSVLFAIMTKFLGLFTPIMGVGKQKEKTTSPAPAVVKDDLTLWKGLKSPMVSLLFIGPLVLGCTWLEVFSDSCDQSTKHIWSTLLHNRWNVFVGAEEYVTWEIAPGRLENNSIVDVWSKSPTVEWDMPGTGSPSTSTSRGGRWRSFPYLAGLEGKDGEALWGYLCEEWNTSEEVKRNPGKRLLRFNFFMLQADVLPNMGFSATRKRLIHSQICDNFVAVVEEKKEGESKSEF